MSTFHMTYVEHQGSEPKELIFPSDRLWEAVERADRKFCDPLRPEDVARLLAILKRDRERRGGKDQPARRD